MVQYNHQKDSKEEIEMTCIDCCYFWREEDEESRCCHWEPRCPGDIPPCEEEEEEDVYD